MSDSDAVNYSAPTTSSTWASLPIGERVSILLSTLALDLFGNLSVTASYEWDDPPYIHRMKAPIQGSIENVFDEWAKGDCFVITHRIETTPDGKSKKKEVAAELSE